MLGRGAKWVGWKEGGWSVEVMYAALRIQMTALSAFIGGISIAKRYRRRCEMGVSLHRIALELP
jgi:hypothetical protein